MLWSPQTFRGKWKIQQRKGRNNQWSRPRDPGTGIVLKARKENAWTMAICPSQILSGCHLLQKVLPDPFSTLGFVRGLLLPRTPVAPIGHTTLCHGCQLPCLPHWREEMLGNCSSGEWLCQTLEYTEQAGPLPPWSLPSSGLKKTNPLNHCSPRLLLRWVSYQRQMRARHLLKAGTELYFEDWPPSP